MKDAKRRRKIDYRTSKSLKRVVCIQQTMKSVLPAGTIADEPTQ